MNDPKIEARHIRKNELRDLREVMLSPAGSRVLARLLEYCRVGKSIWAPGVEIHYNAGAQDVGHFLQHEMEATKETKE